MTHAANSWALAIHGGAGALLRDRISADDDAAIRAALDEALDAGAKVLAAGGAALDAVEAAVRVLEDAPPFNAGRGAALTFDGTVELDAAIVDGRDRNAGAVAGVGRARHPVSLARAVMEHSPHVLLAGAGAEAFGAERGFETADADWFRTEPRARDLAELQARGGGFDVDMKYGTVGAVARDSSGHLAAATSTGGVTGKRWGRIGDSPVPGAGTFADDRSCAVSCTGSGEFFLRVGVGHEIGARVRLTGADLHRAVDETLTDVKALGGSGGTIAVGGTGAPVWSFTTPGMHRGRLTGSSAREIAIYGDEG